MFCHCNNRKQRELLQCMLLVWRPINHTVQFVSAPQRAAPHPAAYCSTCSVRLWVLGSFFYNCWNLDKNVWHQWMTYSLVFPLSKKYACFNMKWYRKIHNILILRLFFSVFTSFILVVCVYIYLNPMSLYYMKKANFMCPCFWVG